MRAVNLKKLQTKNEDFLFKNRIVDYIKKTAFYVNSSFPKLNFYIVGGSHFNYKRQKRVKKHLDKLFQDTIFSNNEDKFRVLVFNTILDTTSNELEKRLGSFYNMNKFNVIDSMF